MLRAVFQWLDIHPSFYWVCGGAATVAVLAALILAARAPGSASRRYDWGFSLLLLGLLLAWRWPFLFSAVEFNPDESQFIAGAHTLAYDPVFWRSVDGVTSGPLDFFALVPLRWLGLPFDYFTARLVGLLLNWITLLGLYRFFRTKAAPVVAQLAVLPAAVFFAIAIDADFVHYSSELVPLALLAVALAATTRRPYVAAFLTGCLPWAKLQAVPLGVALGAWLLWHAWAEARRQAIAPWRRLAALMGCALVPTLIVVGSLAGCGELGHFYRRYVLQNVIYVGGGSGVDSVLHEMARRSAETGHFTLWGAAGLLFLVAAGIAYAVRRQRPSPFFWLGALLTAAAVFCVMLPARTSLHYVLFLIVPLGFWTGAALCELWQTGSRAIAAGLALGCALSPFVARLERPAHGMFGQFTQDWTYPYTPLGSVLRAWHAPGRRMALWGWSNSAYVEGDFRQGTRDAVSQWCIFDLPQRDYYRATYLADLQRNQPELFVDVVGPHDTYFADRATQGHEIFPALADYIRENYRLVTDLPAGRIYARTDFLALHPLTTSEIQRRLAQGRREYEPAASPTAAIPALPAYARTAGRQVRLLQPPAELSWPLRGTERALRLDFGYLPEAHNDHPTDGAEFIAELRMPGKPPLQVYHRMLNPRGQPNDCGPQRAELVLPPYPPGTTLAVRTTAGPAGDNRWDQVYLANIAFTQSPYFSSHQFPGFRRLPATIACAYPYLIEREGSPVLMLPPPAALAFVLEGHERQFNFSYGLAEGAYTGGGATDGATYRVELQRGDQASRLLFERRLDPLGAPGDRGTQSADLALPAGLQPGDRLVLQILPGTGDSWDWSYVSTVVVR